MTTDEQYILRCEVLGRLAMSNGNSAVGAIITLNNRFLVEAEEATRSKNDITCHAEIEVIRKAVIELDATDLSGCTLYTTHEPCIMCAYAIRFHKIKKVVYQHNVNYLGSITSGMPLLTSFDVPPHWSKPPEITQIKPM